MDTKTDDASTPAKESQERRVYYQDLAGVEYVEDSKADPRVHDVYHVTGEADTPDVGSHGHRVRSSNFEQVPYERLAEQTAEEDFSNTESADPTRPLLTPQKQRTSPETGSPIGYSGGHHSSRKHRHKDRKQAMKNVADWIQQTQHLNRHTVTTTTTTTTTTRTPDKNPRIKGSPSVSPDREKRESIRSSAVEAVHRHEHHHVHTHHHHYHYHHYQEQ